MDLLTTAGEDASAATGELWPGLYEIVELTPPKGYHPSEKHIFVDTVSAAGQSEEAVVEYEGLKTNTIRLGAQAIVKIFRRRPRRPCPGSRRAAGSGRRVQRVSQKCGAAMKTRVRLSAIIW